MSLHAVWQLCLVGLGGGFGAMLRFAITKLFLQSWPTYVGIGTLVVNVVGSFLIGIVLARTNLSEGWRIFLVPGFLGGFTTFSALTYETKTLWTASAALSASHLFANVLLGLLAVLAGETFSRWLEL